MQTSAIGLFCPATPVCGIYKDMKKIAVLVSLLLLFGLVNVWAGPRPIPKDAKIYIEKLPLELDMYLKAEIVKKKVPVKIVTHKEDADFVIQGFAEGNEDRKWHEGWLTAEKDHVTAAIEMVDKEGNFVWASEAGDRSWFGVP